MDWAFPRDLESIREKVDLPFVTLERNPFSQDLNERLHGERVPITEEFLLRCLTLLLTDDAEFVSRDKYMLVVGDDEIRGSWTDDGGELLRSHVLVQ